MKSVCICKISTIQRLNNSTNQRFNDSKISKCHKNKQNGIFVWKNRAANHYLDRLSSLLITKMSEIQIKAVTVQVDDGIHLNVKVMGDDPSGSKPLFIGLHGGPGVATSAEPQADFAFLSKKFRVLVFDARGSGASDLIGPYTHDRWVRDIEFLR